jgi:hypothetical protein
MVRAAVPLTFPMQTSNRAITAGVEFIEENAAARGAPELMHLNPLLAYQLLAKLERQSWAFRSLSLL